MSPSVDMPLYPFTVLIVEFSKMRFNCISDCHAGFWRYKIAIIGKSKFPDIDAP